MPIKIRINIFAIWLIWYLNKQHFQTNSPLNVENVLLCE